MIQGDNSVLSVNPHFVFFLNLFPTVRVYVDVRSASAHILIPSMYASRNCSPAFSIVF